MTASATERARSFDAWVMGMAFTASYVRALAGDAQEAFRAELAGILDRHRVADGRPFVVPYRIDLWTATRSD